MMIPTMKTVPLNTPIQRARKFPSVLRSLEFVPFHPIPNPTVISSPFSKSQASIRTSPQQASIETAPALGNHEPHLAPLPLTGRDSQPAIPLPVAWATTRMARWAPGCTALFEAYPMVS
jgi:hypothetical protein